MVVAANPLSILHEAFFRHMEPPVYFSSRTNAFPALVREIHYEMQISQFWMTNSTAEIDTGWSRSEFGVRIQPSIGAFGWKAPKGVVGCLDERSCTEAQAPADAAILSAGLW